MMLGSDSDSRAGRYPASGWSSAADDVSDPLSPLSDAAGVLHVDLENPLIRQRGTWNIVRVKLVLESPTPYYMTRGATPEPRRTRTIPDYWLKEINERLSHK